MWVVGVDACPCGWIAAFVELSGDFSEPRTFSKFADILTAPQNPSIIAVDVPIGLPERGGRVADSNVRPLLGRLKRSVFPIPSRRAIFAEIGPFADQKARYEAHQRACAIAAATSTPSKRIPIQAFAIFPKIREVDELLRSNAILKSQVYETHPEVAFWQLNSRCPLDEPKKVKDRPHTPGLLLRRQLLVQAGFSAALVEAVPPRGSGPDDLLDALACAQVARRIASGDAQSFPDPPERDQFDLPMAIWA